MSNQKTKVSIVKGPKNPQEKEIREMVERAIDLIGGIDDIISKGDRVLIKPNIAVEIKPGETEVSDPRVAKAVYDILVEMGAKPIIGESSAAAVDGEAAFKASGYYDLRDQGYEVINLKKTKTIRVENPNAKVLRKAKIYELAREVDSIVLGENDTLPELDKERTILIGVCTKRYKGLGQYIPGCPPLGREVIKDMVDVFGT